MKRIYAAARCRGSLRLPLGRLVVFQPSGSIRASGSSDAGLCLCRLGTRLMSHPRYSEYHRLELEYNAMVAQYQFEQWNYSRKAQAEGVSMQQFAAVDAAGTAALNQELQAKVAIKQDELNNRLNSSMTPSSKKRKRRRRSYQMPMP